MRQLRIEITDPRMREFPLKPATEGSAGYDLRACIPYPRQLRPGEVVRVSAGFRMSLPEGVCALILPRSGLASEHQVVPANSPGLVDADFRGEVSVALVNRGAKAYLCRPMDRVAQMVIVPVVLAQVVVVEGLGDTGRGANGWGSTGME